MAKKIRLDFSKTEERSGWNTRHISEGLYKMKVASVQETEAGDGTAMLVYALVPEDSRYKTRRFPFYCKLQQNQLWKLRDLLVAAGVAVPKKALNIDPASIVGKSIAAEVEDDSYQGNIRSSVNATYGLDILDEDGAAGDEGDEDDEEYDDEEAEAEDEYEDEAEEEEEEDLSSLTIAELRKRAKGLGIDTAGVKKPDLIDLILEEEGDEESDDEDDDLDDEDLEDEEFEDDEDEDEEEEEPAPKPRRTAKKAPAKAPAKATAKRTVKRR